MRTRQVLLTALKEMICERKAGQITVQALTSVDVNGLPWLDITACLRGCE